MQRWEYLFVTIKAGHARGQYRVESSADAGERTVGQTTPANIVNELGDQGWEMVQAALVPNPAGDGEPSMIVVFKRPRG
jgi:hypothetical protein